MSEFGRWMAAAGLALFPLLSSMNVTLGQNVQVQPAPAQPRPATQAGRGSMVSDQDMVQWLLIDNQGEIQISQIGQKQGKSEAVREFSEQMIKEHTAFIEKLQNATGAGARPGTSGANPRQPGRANEGAAAAGDRNTTEPVAVQQERRELQQERTNVREGGAQPGARQAARGRGPVDLVSLKRELGQECVRSTREMLQQYEGQDFDQAFMGIQLALHQQMLDTLNVFRRHAQSEQLQELLADGAKSTEEHLEHAQKIMQDLEGKSSSGDRPRTARKPQANPQERE